jgi:hypothetical protein
MSSSSQSLTETCVELAWRQWKALGVSATGPTESSVIDPEALILFTAALGDADPRLRDESTDWCARYGARLVAASRLRNLRARCDAYHRPCIDEYLATVNANSQTRWPTQTAAKPRKYRASNKSELPRLVKSRALVRLQLRSVFGMSARAEVLTSFLAGPPVPHTASDLSQGGYSKRTIALVLEDLAFAEVLTALRRGNQIKYRCTGASHLRQVAPAAKSGVLPRWDLWFEMLTQVEDLARRIGGKNPIVQGVEAKRLASDLEATAATLELQIPQPDRPERYFADLVEWLSERVAELSY